MLSAAAITSHDNQTGLDLRRPPSTRGVGALRVHTVPLFPATAGTLAGYGRPIHDFSTCGCDITPWPVSGWRPLCPNTGNEGGVVEDVFRLSRVGGVQFAENVGLGRRYVTGWYGEDPAAAREDAEPPSLHAVLTHEANYHPDGGQVFASRDGQAFVLLLGRPGDDVAPESFAAFLVDPAAEGGCVGVHVDAGTWHQPAFPARGAGHVVMDNRQGRVHACVAVDFVGEWGAYLRVPLG
jgi:ureidoglycolate lyase